MIVVISIYELFEILSIIFCIHYLYGEKPKFDVLTVGVVIVEVAWMQVIYCLNLPSEWSFITYLLTALYCGLKFGFNIKDIFINNMLYALILSSIQATMIVLLYFLLNTSRVNAIENIFINVVIFIIVISALKRCNLQKLSNILKNNDKLIMISVALIVITIVLFLITYKTTKGFSTLYYLVLIVSIILIFIAAIDIGKHKIRVRETEAELKQYRLYASSFEGLIDDIRARQHEFDNHINTVYSQHYLYKTYEELVAAQKKYCQEIIGENRYNKLLSKGNPIILCFLYGKFSELEKRGIEITYKVVVGELEGGVPIHKIVELLGNLLNNAADAVKANGTDRISLTMVERPETISIEVSNESEEIDYKRIQDFFKKGYSEKGRSRGYGLYNVKKICEEY